MTSLTWLVPLMCVVLDAMQVEVIRTYTAKQPDELSLQVADVVLISQSVEDGTSALKRLYFQVTYLVWYSSRFSKLHPFIIHFYTNTLVFDLSHHGAFKLFEDVLLKSRPIQRSQRLFTHFISKNKQHWDKNSKNMLNMPHICCLSCHRLVRRWATAWRREGLVPRRMCRSHHMPSHYRTQHAEDGPPTGAGD